MNATEVTITPPPGLAQKCWDELRNQTQVLDPATGWDKAIALAYQAGADQELEACCEWLTCGGLIPRLPALTESLRAARRPKPPSLKEQALEVLEDANLDAAHYNIILRALESIPEDQ